MKNTTPKLLSRWFYFNPLEWHHLYTGILIIIAYYYYILPVFVFGIGAWLIIDDIGQHRLQKVLGRSYHSYGHYIGKPLYQLRMWLIKRYPHAKWLNNI